MSFKETIRSDPKWKKRIIGLMTAGNGIRPRWWIRHLVNPFFHKKGAGSRIFSRSRMDLVPYNQFELGKGSTVEDFTFVNNGMGQVIIGDHVFIGASNVIIGPVVLHDHIMTAQHVVISGMNHGFSEVDIAFRYQPSSVNEIEIGEGSWIGANAVITAGTKIGKYCVIAAGSVVTRSVPAYTMVAGNPALVIKQYNHLTKAWEKVE